VDYPQKLSHVRFPESTPDILSAVVALMRPTVEIQEVVTTGTTHVLTVCNAFWIHQGMRLTIDSIVYRVTGIQYPNTITLEGSAPVAVESFVMPAPFFFHGTPIATNSDLSQIEEAKDKTPMIWLMEGYVDNNDFGWRSPFDREITARVFGLTDPVDPTQQTPEAYTNAVEPMQRMMQYFEEVLNAQQKWFNTDDLGIEFRQYPKFGVYLTSKGVEKSMFRDNLSGVEASLNRLLHYRQASCAEACD
jgi:hypothetical protein